MIFIQAKWGKFLIFSCLIRILSRNYSKKEERKLLGPDLKTKKRSCFYGNEHGHLIFLLPSYFFFSFPSGQISPAYFVVSNDFPTDESLNTELIRPLERM